MKQALRTLYVCGLFLPFCHQALFAKDIIATHIAMRSQGAHNARALMHIPISPCNILCADACMLDVHEKERGGAQQKDIITEEDRKGNGYFRPWRSFRSRNKTVVAAREHESYQEDENDYCYLGFLGSCLGFSQTIREKSIIETLFNSHNICGCNARNNCTNSCHNTTLTISGSKVENRNDSHDWLADYFYLPTDFKSTVTFNARIRNVIAELDCHIFFDRWLPGLYLSVRVPIVHSRWDFNICENVINAGTHDPEIAQDEQGYFAPGIMSRDHLLFSFTDFLRGNAPLPLTQTFSVTDPQNPGGTVVANGAGGTEPDSDVPVNYTTFFQPLRFAKAACSTQTSTRAADIHFAFGWHSPCNQACMWGIRGILVAPAGTRARGALLFEPTIGNGHHWELGLGLHAEWGAWHSYSYPCSVNFVCDAAITHLFTTRRYHTFDLTGRPLSRYMLAEHLGSPLTFLGAPDPATGSARTRINKLRGSGSGVGQNLAIEQFRQEFSPIANLTTVQIHTSVPAHIEATASIKAGYGDIHWETGYNLWIRLPEEIRRKCPAIFDTNQSWALKGDARMYGFLESDSPAIAPGPPAGTVIIRAGTPIALSATESHATLYSGTNKTFAANEKIDGPQLAREGDNLAAPAGPPVNLNTTPTSGVQINTSIQPIFLTSSDLPVCSRGNGGISSTLFSHVSYYVQRCDRIRGMIGVGGEIEWGHNNLHSRSFPRFAFSQWGIWLKGTLVF